MSYDLRPLGVVIFFWGAGEEDIEAIEGGFPICEVLKGIFGWLEKVVTPQIPSVLHNINGLRCFCPWKCKLGFFGSTGNAAMIAMIKVARSMLLDFLS